MGWNIFKGHKKDEEKALLQEIDSSLKKTKLERRMVEKEIEEIKDWAANAIIDAYADFFPNSNLTYYRKQYAETALEEYQKIKEKFAPRMNSDDVQKCDDIVKSYLNQIKIREEKLKLLEQLEAEYRESKEKLKQAKLQEDRQLEKMSREERLLEHNRRLKVLEEQSNKKIAEIEKESYKLEDIKQEVVYHEEYHKELNRLNKQFEKDKEPSLDEDIFNLDKNKLPEDKAPEDSPSSFKDEIDNLLNNLDNQ